MCHIGQVWSKVTAFWNIDRTVLSTWILYNCFIVASFSGNPGQLYLVVWMDGRGLSLKNITLKVLFFRTKSEK